MTKKVLVPDSRQQIRDIWLRLDALERRLFRRRDSGITNEVVFNLAGPIEESTSGRWYLRESARLRHVVVSLATAGTTTSTVVVYKNDVVLLTIDLEAGVQLRKALSVTVFAADDDHVRVGLTDAAVDAEDLTVQLRFG